MEPHNGKAASPTMFAGRTVVVSGAAGKLGRRICNALGEAGANVVVNDVREDAVNELVTLLTSAGHSAIGVPLSATHGPGIISKAVGHFGAMHAVINSILAPIPWGPFEDSSNDQFRDNFEANVLGPLSIIRAAWPHFKAQRSGRVVNFTSDSLLGFPKASTYTTTKGALFGVNKTLALEGAEYNIKINCVSPIAFVPAMERHIQLFSPDVQKAFRTLYTPEANVPLILALVSEGCEASGEVFNTAGRSVGRNVWGYVEGKAGLKTVEECLAYLPELCEKGGRNVFEPCSQRDFTEWQAKYALGQ